VSASGEHSPRYPIEVLARLRAPGPAKVAGRVVDRGPRRVLVKDVTGAVWVRGESELGAWVIAEGTWNGELLAGSADGEEDAELAVQSTPSAAFPKTGGEWRWYQDVDTRRLENLKVRARLLRALRGFFEERAFLEVETPSRVPSPGLDLHLDAFESEGRWLITSPEYQMKRLLAGGAPRIFQACRCFRRGERGDLHEPEFTMLEWYRAFVDSEAVMRDTEQLVAALARTLHEGSTLIPARGTPVDVAPPWERIRVEDAFPRFAGVRLDEVLPDEERFFRILVTKIEPQLGRTRPVFLTHWPASMASLARLVPGDRRWAERFEAYVAGIELCNGFGELIDPVEQRARLVRDDAARRAAGQAAYPIDERFLGALEEGLPPCSGNALGFDRLVMLLLGAARIQDVVAFPAERL